jgi:hypothetical protein
MVSFYHSAGRIESPGLTLSFFGAHPRTAPERGCVADQPQQLRKTGRTEYT